MHGVSEVKTSSSAFLVAACQESSDTSTMPIANQNHSPQYADASNDEASFNQTNKRNEEIKMEVGVLLQSPNNQFEFSSTDSPTEMNGYGEDINSTPKTLFATEFPITILGNICEEMKCKRCGRPLNDVTCHQDNQKFSSSKKYRCHFCKYIVTISEEFMSGEASSEKRNNNNYVGNLRSFANCGKSQLKRKLFFNGEENNNARDEETRAESSEDEGFFLAADKKKYKIRENHETTRNDSGITLNCFNCGEIFSDLRLLSNHECVAMRSSECDTLDSMTTDSSGGEENSKMIISGNDRASVIEIVRNSERRICESVNAALANANAANTEIISEDNQRNSQLAYANSNDRTMGPLIVQNEDESDDPFRMEVRNMKRRGEFPCRLCTKIFRNLRALKGHARIHISGNRGNVPFECNVCTFSTMDKSMVIRHIRGHNGDHPYKCQMCLSTFTTKANCERHLRNAHRKTSREDIRSLLVDLNAKSNNLLEAIARPNNAALDTSARPTNASELNARSDNALDLNARSNNASDSNLGSVNAINSNAGLNASSDLMAKNAPDVSVDPINCADSKARSNKTLNSNLGASNASDSNAKLSSIPNLNSIANSIFIDTNSKITLEPTIKRNNASNSNNLRDSNAGPILFMEQSNVRRPVTVRPMGFAANGISIDISPRQALSLDDFYRSGAILTNGAPSKMLLMTGVSIKNEEDTNAESTKPPKIEDPYEMNSLRRHYDSNSAYGYGYNYNSSVSEVESESEIDCVRNNSYPAVYSSDAESRRPNITPDSKINHMYFEPMKHNLPAHLFDRRFIPQVEEQPALQSEDQPLDLSIDVLDLSVKKEPKIEKETFEISPAKNKLKNIPDMIPLRHASIFNSPESGIKTFPRIPSAIAKRANNVILTNNLERNYPAFPLLRSPVVSMQTENENAHLADIPNLLSIHVAKKEGDNMNLPLIGHNFGLDNSLSTNNNMKPRKPSTDRKSRSKSTVRMVMKNGVLVEKPKQRRYRTEKPFSCPHCFGRFTLRSNMDRHIKQQHPKFWCQRQRGAGKSRSGASNYEQSPEFADIGNNRAISPGNESPNLDQRCDDSDIGPMDGENYVYSSTEIKREMLSPSDVYNANEDYSENESYVDDEANGKAATLCQPILKEENSDLASVNTLLSHVNTQKFPQYFHSEEERMRQEDASDEDEEGLVAGSGSSSEGNASGSEEIRTGHEISNVNVGLEAIKKKKSAYSLAPNRVECKFCSRSFPWASSLRRHILTHTGQKPYKCASCPLLFTTKSNCDRHFLRKHRSEVNDETVRTVIANVGERNIIIASDTNANAQINTNDRSFKCNICFFSHYFATLRMLRRHYLEKHGLSYDVENASSSELDEMRIERDIIDAPSPTIADHSPLLAARSPSVDDDNHSDLEIADAVSEQNQLPYKCHLCDCSFAERKNTLEHISVFHSQEYNLLVCKGALDNLSRQGPEYAAEDFHSVSEESPEYNRNNFPDYSSRKVICAFCMRRFWSAEDLRRHMRTHTGERPFACDICDRRFTLKHSMLRHRKKHSATFYNSGNNSSPNSEDEDSHHSPVNESQVSVFDQMREDFAPIVKSEPLDDENAHTLHKEHSVDLIAKLLDIDDKSLVDEMITSKSADDVAKMLGVRK